MNIQCKSCGKSYDFNKHETCPNCGGYTRPNKGKKSTKSESIENYRQNKMNRSVNEDSDYNTYNEKNDYNSSSRINKAQKKTSKRKKSFMSRVYIFVGIAIFITSILDIISSEDEDYLVEDEAAVAVEEDYYDYDEYYDYEEYFENIVSTPLGYFQINSVSEIQGETSNEDHKIIAFEIEYESNYLDKPEDQEWEVLNYIGLEYLDYNGVVTNYPVDITDKVWDTYYTSFDYLNESEISSSDYMHGVMYFEIPSEVPEFDFVIQTQHYSYEEETTSRFVSSYGYGD